MYQVSKTNSRQTTSYVNTEKENENVLISQIITRDQKTIRQETGLAGEVIYFTTNVSMTQIYVSNISSAAVNRKNK